MKFTTADQAMREYLRLREMTVAPGGSDPYADRRDVLVDRCPKCKKAEWRYEAQADQWICKTEGCNTWRTREPAAILRGTFQENALVRVRGGRVHFKGQVRAGGNSTAEALSDIGSVWVVLTQQQQDLLALRSRGTWPAVLIAARALWPWEKWYEKKVRQIVRLARVKAEERMVALGLMAEEELAS